MYVNNIQSQDNITSRSKLKSLNAINPISHYTNGYLNRSAKVSRKKFTPISKNLEGKIEKIKLDKISVWEINPEKYKDYIFFLHGMAQNVSDYQPLYEAALKNGKGVLAVEYRSYGENKKSRLSEDNLRKDVEKAYKYLTEEKKIKPENIIVIGHSMGGALATNFASRYKNIKSLILLSPITTFANIGKKFMLNETLGMSIPKIINKLTERIKPLKWLFNLRLNSQNKIGKVETPTYILQSKNDTVTLIDGARKLAKTAKEKGILKNFIIFPLGGHKVDSKKVEAVSNILKELD